MVHAAVISSAVEGPTDEAISVRLVEAAGGTLGPVYGRNGKQNLLNRLGGFNAAARYSPWLVLIDLDNDFDCAPLALPVWLAEPSEMMCFRISVREVEAWLLADRNSLAAFLGVSVALIPGDPESLADPKAAMVDLARRSRRRDIREDMVPRPGSGRNVGPGYAGQVMAFALESWQPDVAAESAPSLRKCMAALETFVAAHCPQA